MKALKIVLGIIVLLVALVLILALFVKKDYRITRSIVINRPNATVFEYVRLQKNQDLYNKWVMADPGMEKSYKGTDGQTGFVYAWNGKKAGQGEQEIIELQDGKLVKTELRFKKPMENTGIAEMQTIAESDNATNVTWIMAGKSKYPLNIMNLFLDNLLGKDMDTSLHNLKAILEKS